MRGQLATLWMFLRFCVIIDAVEQSLDETILLPKATKEDARDRMLNVDRAREILDYVETLRYATLEHALWETLCQTGMRIGEARGLNVSDYNDDEGTAILRLS
jgi:integrase